jgi:hypothetical protein
VKTAPRSSLEMVKAEFLLQLWIRLLADPARLDGRGESVFRSANNTPAPFSELFPPAGKITVRARSAEAASDFWP